MADSQRNWSGLPKDVLVRIHDSLNGGSINRQLLRAVCPAWRAALPLAGDERRRPPPPPLLQAPLFTHPFVDLLMVELTNLPPHEILQLNRNLLVSPHEPNQKWIIQVHQTRPGNLSLFNPLTGRKLQFPPGVKIDHVNLLEYHITDLGTFHTLRSRKIGRKVGPSRKLIALTSLPVLMALSEEDELRFWQPGLEKWSEFHPRDIFGENIFSDDDDAFFGLLNGGGIKDIVSYKEMFYAVEEIGRLLVFNSLSWREPDTIVSEPIITGMEKGNFVYIYLVVSEGSLYLAVRIKKASRSDMALLLDESLLQDAPTDVRVYVLKEETGKEPRWDEAKSIGDRVFLVGQGSNFSISSVDHGWDVKDRIYFGGSRAKSDKFNLEFGLGAGIYDLGSGHFVQFNCWADHGVHTRLFWPPPRWVDPNANLDPEADPYERLHNLRMVEVRKSEELFKKKFPERHGKSWAVFD